MRGLLFILSFFPAAGPLSAQEAPVKSTVSWYSVGDALRRAGNPGAAKEAFQRLLKENPSSGGAFEGLTLSCLALGENEEALSYARRWKENSRSAYVLAMEATALRRLRRADEQLGVEREIVALEPCNLRSQRRLDDLMTRRRGGILPHFRMSRSLGVEGLDTPRPQRIAYASRSGGLRARQPLSAKLDLVAGASVSEDIQQNDTRGFTYFDILEQVYSFGLEGRPDDDLSWQAEYGQAALSDVKGEGVGKISFSRLRAGALWSLGDYGLGLEVQRRPKYLRGTGASTYFEILRRGDLLASAEGPAAGFNWLLRAGLSDFSDQTTYKNFSLLGTKEFGRNLFQPNYSHGQQEYFGATPGGRLGFIVTDRLGARFRHLAEDSYQLSASYGKTFYRDGNAQDDFSGQAQAWLPWLKDCCGSRPLSAAYRYETENYDRPAEPYRSTTRHSHALGAYWRQGWAGGSWTTLGLEHSFYTDSRGGYEGNAAVAETEAYRRGDFSLSANGRIATTNIRDESYSAGFTARYSF